MQSPITCATFLTPADSFYGRQWHYPLINLPQAWETTTGNPNVIVAVIDSGVVLGHPDLQGQLVAGYDFISSADNALDGDGIDADPDDPGDRTNPDGSSSFHGTHVAGTVAAATDNSLGVAGIAWNARIMPLRALGTFGGSDYDIAQGMAARRSTGICSCGSSDLLGLCPSPASPASPRRGVYCAARTCHGSASG